MFIFFVSDIQVFDRLSNFSQPIRTVSQNLEDRRQRSSIIYLNSENTHAPKFFGEAFKATRNTKNLGLIVDYKLNFIEDLQQVVRKVAKQLNTFEKFCGSKWDLKQRTPMKLYKTIVLPQFLYASPVLETDEGQRTIKGQPSQTIPD